MDDITVASTTDSKEDVAAAAGVTAVEEPEEQQEEETPEGEEPEGEEEQESEEEPVEEEEEEEEEPEEEEAEEEKPVKKAKSPTEFLPKKVQKRVAVLTARNYAVEEENASLKRRLQEVERGVKKDDVVVAPQPIVLPADMKEPKEDDFEDYKKYIAALAKYEAKKAEYELAVQRNREAVNAYTKEVFDDYNRGVSAARAEYEDFDEVVGNDDLKISPTARVAIIELGGDVGPHVAYYLGSHPEEVHKLAEMSDARQVMRIGQLATKFEGEEEEEVEAPPKKKPVTTKATAPIRPVTRASGKTQTSVSMDKMPYQDYKRIREQQERGRRR